jgi:hypothetical protein
MAQEDLGLDAIGRQCDSTFTDDVSAVSGQQYDSDLAMALAYASVRSHRTPQLSLVQSISSCTLRKQQ